MEYRIEKDTMGEMQVPANSLWAAQTQRSLQNFKIGGQKMPTEIIRAFAILKKAAAFTNTDAGVLPADKRNLIARVCDEILEGKPVQPFWYIIERKKAMLLKTINIII